jgi:preprotein translocase subunit YajC
VFAYLLSVFLIAQAAADAPTQPAATPPAVTAPAQPADTAAKADPASEKAAGEKAATGDESNSHQTGATAGTPATPAPAAEPFDFKRFAMMIIVTGILFYLIMLRPQRRKEQEARDRLNNIKENERVVTIGGIHGVVTNVRRDQGRVTIRVDETTGAKLQINLSAIARVVTDDDDKAAEGKK